MKTPVSVYAKAFATGIGGTAVAVAATVPNSTVGKWAAVIVALLAAMGLTARTRNTEIVKTGPGVEPTVTKVLSTVGDVGTTVGTVVVDTGTAVGGVVAGTTGGFGRALNATIGKLIPGKGANG